jgi:hypothetical protein
MHFLGRNDATKPVLKINVRLLVGAGVFGQGSIPTGAFLCSQSRLSRGISEKPGCLTCWKVPCWSTVAGGLRINTPVAPSSLLVVVHALRPCPDDVPEESGPYHYGTPEHPLANHRGNCAPPSTESLPPRPHTTHHHSNRVWFCQTAHNALPSMVIRMII